MKSYTLKAVLEMLAFVLVVLAVKYVFVNVFTEVGAILVYVFMKMLYRHSVMKKEKTAELAEGEVLDEYWGRLAFSGRLGKVDRVLYDYYKDRYWKYFLIDIILFSMIFGVAEWLAGLAFNAG